MMLEIKRVLRPNGVLIISTLEKAAYTDATGLVNEFHVKELYRPEFTELMSRHFRHVSMHSQRIGFGSVIAYEAGLAQAYEIDSDSVIAVKGLVSPLYLVAVASDEPEAIFSITSLFSQEMQASEPVLARVKFERNAWEESSSRTVRPSGGTGFNNSAGSSGPSASR